MQQAVLGSILTSSITSHATSDLDDVSDLREAMISRWARSDSSALWGLDLVEVINRGLLAGSHDGLSLRATRLVVDVSAA